MMRLLECQKALKAVELFTDVAFCSCHHGGLLHGPEHEPEMIVDNDDHCQ